MLDSICLVVLLKISETAHPRCPGLLLFALWENAMACTVSPNQCQPANGNIGSIVMLKLNV